MPRMSTLLRSAFVFAIVGLLSVAASAQRIYYVDAEAGSDLAAGTSEAAAWKTLARVSKAKLEPGDQVLLRRGRIWWEGLEINFSGARGKPIVIATYGEGERPVLSGLVPLSEPKFWTEITKGLWATAEGTLEGDIGHLWSDAGIVGKRAAGREELKEPWQFFYDTQAKRLIVKLDGNPAEAARGLAAAGRAFGLKLHHRDDITIRDLAVEHFAVHGLSGYNNRRVRVEGCRFAWIGGALVPGASVGFGNGVEFGGNVSDCVVADCFFEQIYDSAITHQNWDQDGRDQRNILFRNNRIDRCAVGIEVFSHSGATQNCTYRHNVITNCGRGWSGNGGLWASGFRIVSSKIDFENLRVEGNRIENSLHCGMFLSGGEVNLSDNVVTGCEVGLYITAQNGNRPWTGHAQNNVIARNGRWGVYIVDSGGHCRFTNNTIVNNGDASEWNRHNVMLDGASNTTWRRNVLASEKSLAISVNNDTHTLDENVYFRASGPVIGWDNTRRQFTMDQFEEYCKLSGQDAHSRAADPRFADAEALDFTVDPAGPCRLPDGNIIGAASPDAR
jgi:parallel beta-helix repeat protein